MCDNQRGANPHDDYKLKSIGATKTPEHYMISELKNKRDDLIRQLSDVQTAIDAVHRVLFN